MASQKIEQEAVDVMFGGPEKFQARIDAFIKALENHAKSEGEPMPTEHGVIEQIVRRYGGSYEIVPTPKREFRDVAEDYKPVPPPAVPPVTVESTLADRIADLAEIRFQRQMDGIVYKGHPIPGDPQSLNALMSILIASAAEDNVTVRWKDGDGSYFTIDKSDVHAMIKSIRKLTQDCYDNEYRILTLLKAETTIDRINRVKLITGWPA